MSSINNIPATPEDKVVHCALTWRATEKLAIAAPADQQQEAQRAHHRAKMQLRKAADEATRGRT